MVYTADNGTRAGLSLQSAVLSDGLLEVNDGSSSLLDSVSIVWDSLDHREESTSENRKFATPVYLYPDRQHLLFTAPLSAKSPLADLLQHGVALMAAE